MASTRTALRDGFLPKNAIVMAKKSLPAAPISTRSAVQLVFIAETPIIQEAEILFTKMVQAMGLGSSDIEILNLGQPDLIKQIEQLAPLVVVGLGSPTAFEASKYRATHFITTFHPSYLITNPQSKKQAWEDLKQVAKRLGIEIPKVKN